jgi:hypothetical protein
MKGYIVDIKSGEKYDKFICRPTIYGCPEEIQFKYSSRKEVLEEYEKWVRSQPELVQKIKNELKGLILGCHCSNVEICHGNVLIKISEED